MNPIQMILGKLVSTFLTKKRVIGWVSALAILGGAAAASMDSKEFKSIVCEAPTIEVK